MVQVSDSPVVFHGAEVVGHQRVSGLWEKGSEALRDSRLGPPAPKSNHDTFHYGKICLDIS